jgi:hypothetical protein
VGTVTFNLSVNLSQKGFFQKQVLEAHGLENTKKQLAAASQEPPYPKVAVEASLSRRQMQVLKDRQRW